MAIEYADFDGLERLAAFWGGEVTSTFDHLELVTLRECDVVEEVMIGEDKVIKLGGKFACFGRGGRILHDGLCIFQATVKDARTIYVGNLHIFYFITRIKSHVFKPNIN